MTNSAYAKKIELIFPSFPTYVKISRLVHKRCLLNKLALFQVVAGLLEQAYCNLLACRLVASCWNNLEQAH